MSGWRPKLPTDPDAKNPKLPPGWGERFHPPPAVSVTGEHARTCRKSEPILTGLANICSYTAWLPVEYREEPCRSALNRVNGHALQLVAEPLHGLRPPLHVLLRPGLRAARRPARRTTVRHLDPSQDQRRRGPSPRARPAILGTRDRRRSAPQPTPTSRPRAAIASPGPASRRWPKREPVRHHHARPDDRPRHRRARRGGAPRQRLRDLLDPDTRRGRLAQDGASTAHPRQRLRALSMLVDAGIKTGVGMAPILPGTVRQAGPTCRSREGGARRRRDAASGRTSSTSAPARASTFSTTSPRDWPELLPHYRQALRRARVPRAGQTKPIRRKSPRWPASSASPTGAPGRSSRRGRRNNSIGCLRAT